MSDSSTGRSLAADVHDQPRLRAKHLGLRLPVITDAPELVPARMINEVFYWEGSAWLRE